jgi:hypothetical protein
MFETAWNEVFAGSKERLLALAVGTRNNLVVPQHKAALLRGTRMSMLDYESTLASIYMIIIMSFSSIYSCSLTNLEHSPLSTDVSRAF